MGYITGINERPADGFCGHETPKGTVSNSIASLSIGIRN